MGEISIADMIGRDWWTASIWTNCNSTGNGSSPLSSPRGVYVVIMNEKLICTHITKNKWSTWVISQLHGEYN